MRDWKVGDKVKFVYDGKQTEGVIDKIPACTCSSYCRRQVRVMWYANGPRVYVTNKGNLQSVIEKGKQLHFDFVKDLVALDGHDQAPEPLEEI